jgi:FixJ family two-component response regulator
MAAASGVGKAAVVSQPLIAILDDDEAYRRALSRVLKANGFDTAVFAAGEALLCELSRRDVACVLLDIEMPGMSGFDVLEALRAQRPSAAVIVVTAHDEAEYCERALGLGAREYRHKPLHASTLLGAIRRACGEEGAADTSSC